MPAAKFKKILLDFPNQFGLGLELAAKLNLKPARHDRVFVCGMGGSTLGASLLNTYLDLKPDLKVCRTYSLPNDVTEKSLIIASSYSGNTIETLTASEQALREKLPLIVITSGGELLRWAQEKEVPFVKLPEGLPPRLTLGLQFSILSAILAQKGLVDNDPEALIEAAAEIAQDAEIKVKGQEIADQIALRVPLIYTSSRLGALARNWKIKFNETAKVPAFWNTLPEANHNELNGFATRGELFHLITLQDEGDDPQILKRIKLTEHYARENGLTVSSGQLRGTSFLARLLHTVWLGDWAALALAQNKKVDPLSTPLIERFKKDLI